MNKLFFWFAVFTCITNVVPIWGQEKIAFEVPSETVSLLTAPDPNCPLKLSGPFKIIGYPNGGLLLGYTIENRSKANIESFTIEELSWFGNRGYSIPALVRKDWLFAPSLGYSTLINFDKKTLGVYDLNRAVASGIATSSNKIWLVMVVKVRLSDGTVYDGSRNFGLLTDFIDEMNLNSTTSVAELAIGEHKLRKFVSKLFADSKQH